MSAGPVSELLSKASSREVVNPGDGKSGSTFERVVISGDRYFLKRLSPRVDWIMRITGDHIHRPYQVWKAGIMSRAPASIDHTVVAMEITGTGDDAELATLMRDVGDAPIPEGDSVVTMAQHHGLLDALADLSAEFWGWTDDIGGSTVESRLRFFAPDNIAPELEVDDVPGTLTVADRGWTALKSRSPLLFRTAQAIHATPSIVAGPLARTPVTFLHGDWKMGNLGMHPDGRVILVDWAYPGSGPVCWDLCWYIALNRARLPESKEATIAYFREALEARAIPTAGWWETQLGLCVVGMMATFGWEKALGDDDELAWWEGRVAEVNVLA